MSEFNNVTVRKAANIYFDGKVTSRSITCQDGSEKTLGIMLPGEYTFNTDSEELMEIIKGELKVLLPGDEDWREIKGGESFTVAAKSQFSLRITQLTDYCCSFIK